MKKAISWLLSMVLVAGMLTGCGEKQQVKIGVAFGVGPAARWPLEMQYMEEYAAKAGILIETRMNKDETAKPFVEDCMELLDSDISVLIVRPRDPSGMQEVAAYAREKGVKLVSYASLIEDEPVDLFVGYDCEYIGQRQGSYLAELVPEGDYIFLWGAPRDRNVEDIHRGAMKGLASVLDNINIIMDEGSPGWSPDEAKVMVKDAVTANGNQVDAILAFNDKLAGAAREALQELGIEEPVVITGMDAEIDALKRIVAGTQASTLYMDLKELAETAMEQSFILAQGKNPESNYELDNGSGKPVLSNLVAGKFVVQENLDRVLIEGGYFTASQIYDTMDQGGK